MRRSLGMLYVSDAPISLVFRFQAQPLDCVLLFISSKATLVADQQESNPVRYSKTNNASWNKQGNIPHQITIKQGASLGYTWLNRRAVDKQIHWPSVSRLVFITKNAQDIQTATVKQLVCCFQSEEKKKDLTASEMMKMSSLISKRSWTLVFTLKWQVIKNHCNDITDLLISNIVRLNVNKFRKCRGQL